MKNKITKGVAEVGLKKELEQIKGVQNVEITCSGSDYTVNVTLHELDFPVFEKVVAKELELYGQHPDKNYKFEITEGGTA